MQCLGCRTDNSPQAKFCLGCDARLVIVCPAVASTIRSPSPVSYTPRHLAGRILTSRSDPENERKQITVPRARLNANPT